jgi:hypothetical protein
MNIGKLLGKAVRYAKANPEKVLVIASVLAPGAVAKVAPIVIAATRKPEA